MEIILFAALLGNLCRLNATRFAFHIRSRVGGHSLHVQTLQPFQTPNPSAVLKIFIASATKTLKSDMFEALVGVKEPHPLQRNWVLPRLKMAQSGQGRQRLKTVLHFHKVGAMPPPLSVKIRSRCWSRQIFGATAVGFLVISTIRSISSATNMAPSC